MTPKSRKSKVAKPKGVEPPVPAISKSPDVMEFGGGDTTTPKSEKKKARWDIKTTPTTLRPTVSTRPVSWKLATLLRELDTTLVMEFGPHDIAYVVMGDEQVLSASCAEYGVVVPDIEPEPEEGQVYLESWLWQMPDGTRIESPVLGVGVIHPAGKNENPNLDEQVVKFESGMEYVLPVPVSGTVVSPPPWDHVIRVIRPDIEINPKYWDEV